jgi:ABC-2 type transport system permease protein
MLTRIIRHEWRTMAADRSIWLVAALFLAIVGYSVYNGAAWVRFQERTLDSAARDEEERLADLRREVAAIEAGGDAPASLRDPRSPAVVGGSRGQRYAMARPGPLAALAVGQGDLYPYYFEITNRSKQTFINNDEIENPTNLLAGRFDLGFVSVFLFPLLILALSYNLISAEREQGTLAMALAQPVRLRTLAIGKVAFRSAVVLTLAIGLAAVGSLVAGIDLSRPETVGRLALWSAVIAAYGGFWFALAVAVNALGRGSATNAIALVALWIALVVVAPALVNVAVTSLHPVPSRVELIRAMREASREASSRGSKVLARYYEDHPELAPADKDKDAAPADFMVTSQAVQESVDRSIAPVLDRYDVQLARQQALVDRLRFLSPAIVAQEALNDVAGTGLARHKHFLGQVDAYHKAWQDFFIPKIMRREMLKASDFAAIPEFRFREEPVGEVCTRVAVGVAGLALPALAVGLLGLAALRRYPIAG